MAETNAVVWVHPSKCTKRDDEIALLSASQSRSQLVSIENQSLKLTPSPAEPEAAWATPMKLQMCLKRRGLALDMCNLISWHEHEKWLATLFEAFNQEAPQGFSPPSLPQILKADRELFLRMAKDVESLKLDKDGNKPLDLALVRLRCDPRVTMHLLSVAGGRQSTAVIDDPTSAGGESKKKKKKQKKDKKTTKKTEQAEKETKRPTPPSKVDYKSTTKEGERICVLFNTKGCAVTGDKCPKGVHVCSFCLKPRHSYKDCRSRSGGSK
jgi:hypothetical protein